MLFSSMASNFLASSIAFIATVVMAGPFLGILLGILSSFHFRDLKFANLWNFDTLARMVFEWVSARRVFQLQW